MTLKEYPQDYFLVFQNDPYREGRITVNRMEKSFSVEIDVVQKESRKIFKHVDILYHFEDEQEAIDAGVQRLSQFLKGED
ncbi:MAG: hypothetical protein EP326_03555 [Deltaproteobacteria bacterium]|jgi:hypothetical protein|nr:MAG: hypothetical protein EP326_03555 [Deltaproteobacteria bacterium]TNF30743.1 MAG: hypothetical protein EP319_04150 [Deltaproteobacteria bacterium]